MTPEEKAKMDQGMAELAESMPSFLYRFYSNCIKEGFDDDQAMALVMNYLQHLVIAGRPGDA